MSHWTENIFFQLFRRHTSFSVYILNFELDMTIFHYLRNIKFSRFRKIHEKFFLGLSVKTFFFLQKLTFENCYNCYINVCTYPAIVSSIGTVNKKFQGSIGGRAEYPELHTLWRLLGRNFFFFFIKITFLSSPHLLFSNERLPCNFELHRKNRRKLWRV